MLRSKSPFKLPTFENHALKWQQCSGMGLQLVIPFSLNLINTDAYWGADSATLVCNWYSSLYLDSNMSMSKFIWKVVSDEWRVVALQFLSRWWLGGSSSKMWTSPTTCAWHHIYLELIIVRARDRTGWEYWPSMWQVTLVQEHYVTLLSMRQFLHLSCNKTRIQASIQNEPRLSWFKQSS
jgi:hypothetical protein